MNRLHDHRPLVKMPWWCSPAGISIGFLIPIMGIIYLAGESDAPGLTVRGVRFLNADYLLLGVLLVLALAVSAWIGAQIQLPGRPVEKDELTNWDYAIIPIGLIALFAYSIWFKDILFNPSVLIQVLTGAFKPERDEIGLTPGVTSLVNVAPAFHGIYALRSVDGSGVRRPRIVHVLFAMLLSLTVFRVYVWSERLAMIELLVPFGLAVGRWLMTCPGRTASVLRTLGPFAALPLIIMYFGAAEYARSWASPTYNGKMSFWEFAVGRFASYYYTALNNGAGMLVILPNGTWEFEFLLEWFHKAPFGLGKPFSEYVGWTNSRFFWYLESFQDPEFNSPSAIYAVVADMGLYGGLGYFLLEGLASGLAFRAYRSGSLPGALLFPICFISLLEIYRYSYLGQPRAFTWVLGMILVSIFVMVIAAVRKARAAGRATSSHRSWAPTVLTAPSGLGD